MPATFFVPGWTAERYQATVERILADGHEIGHHGHSHWSPLRMTEAEERQDIEAGLAALDRFGLRPQGYRTPSWEPSPRTFDLLAEYGFDYDSSLMDDDRPYVLETANGAAGGAARPLGLDDWNQYMYLPDPRSGPGHGAPAVAGDPALAEELDGMRRHGCLFCLTMHPFLSGRPGRVEGCGASSSTRLAAATSSSCHAARRRAAPARTTACRAGRCPCSSSARSIPSRLSRVTGPPYRPIDARVYPRFAGVRTFMRLPHVTDLAGVDAAVYGIPFDTAVTFRPGARFGPEAIRSASALLRPFHSGFGIDVCDGSRSSTTATCR